MTETATAADELGTFTEESAGEGYRSVEFQADSELIRELGERLVGADYIALAELVKNAFDADATKCEIFLSQEKIVVSDNGTGMTEEEFRNLWMRIGSTHKRARGRSAKFGRNVTGSKGVGRLAAQFLAHKLQLVTVPEKRSEQAVHALVDWDIAVTAGDLTKAEARYRIEPEVRVEFPGKSRHGTSVILEGLKHRWSQDDVRQLGRQLWMLNSPFPRFGQLTTGHGQPNDFRIKFNTILPGLDAAFEGQMRAAIDAYHAAIEGELIRDGDRCVSHVRVRFRDGQVFSEQFEHEPLIQSAKWQIRVYDLVGRQPSGVPVGVAREYFEQFGVMVFDAGFRLPYYGANNDWLNIERDHAGRLSRSQLLPDRLQVTRGLNDLPTQDRLLGVVAINTGAEARLADEIKRKSDEYLQILVTRDRLVSNRAYTTLYKAVRQSLDLYATRERSRSEIIEQIISRHDTPATKIRRIETLIQETLERYPFDDRVAELRNEVRTLDNVVQQSVQADEAARVLLGPLASAGMAALALEHETRKEVARARHKLHALRDLAIKLKSDELGGAVTDLEAWLTRLEGTRRVFSPLLEPEDRETSEVLPAASTVREIAANVAVLIPTVEIKIDVDRSFELPRATYAEWHALFQNVFLNAANAMLDTAEPRISVASGLSGRRAWLRINDAGTGVDLQGASRLFDPFNRSLEISRDRKELGLGGMGLGLTIVRMIANQRGCEARFVNPEAGWNTTFELSWIAK